MQSINKFGLIVFPLNLTVNIKLSAAVVVIDALLRQSNRRGQHNQPTTVAKNIFRLIFFLGFSSIKHIFCFYSVNSLVLFCKLKLIRTI